MGIDNVDYCSFGYGAGGVVGDTWPVGPGKAFRTLKGMKGLRRAEDAERELQGVRQFAQRGKKNVRDSRFKDLPDEEVSRRAKDPSLSPKEKRDYQREEKARRQRNKQKRGG